MWGVRIPEVHDATVIRSSDARAYALSGVSAHIGETVRRFEEVLELVLHSVSVELRAKKLGSDVKKVTRRINALDAVVIPALAREVRAIRQTLEEREREDLFRIKRFKGGDGGMPTSTQS